MGTVFLGIFLPYRYFVFLLRYRLLHSGRLFCYTDLGFTLNGEKSLIRLIVELRVKRRFLRLKNRVISKLVNV